MVSVVLVEDGRRPTTLPETRLGPGEQRSVAGRTTAVVLGPEDLGALMTGSHAL
jgi:hypothetical protein